MPVIKTKKGYKCGDSGKEYIGTSAKQKASKQCQAIYSVKNSKKTY